MSEPTGGGNQKPDHDQGQQSYETGAPTESNVSAIVLTILSVLSLVNFLALGSLALGIIALAKRSTDPAESRRLTRIGWIVFAVVWALLLVSIVAVTIFARVRSGDVPSSDTRV